MGIEKIVIKQKLIIQSSTKLCGTQRVAKSMKILDLYWYLNQFTYQIILDTNTRLYQTPFILCRFYDPLFV